MPKVTVIIPVYNNEKYLEECLESVLAQTLTDIEIICINDGSTDDSLRILNNYAKADKRLKVITKPNAGFGHTMNLGIQIAQSEYIGIVESDDYILPETYELYYSAAAKHGYVDIVKSNFMRFYGDKNNRVFELRRLTDKEAYYQGVWNPSADLGLFRLNNLSQCGIYRRKFLVDCRVKYNESPGASYQDNGFWFQTFSQAKTSIFLSDALYLIRRDNEDSSVNSTEKVYCICKEYDFIRDWLKSKSNLNKHLPFICSLMRFKNYMWTLGRISPVYKSAFITRFSDDFRVLHSVGELSKDYFEPKEWRTLMKIVYCPEKYYEEKFSLKTTADSNNNILNGNNKEIFELRKQIKRLDKQMKGIKKSKSFRIGKAVTKLPRLIKDISKMLVQKAGKDKSSRKSKESVSLAGSNSSLKPPSVNSIQEAALYLQSWYLETYGELLDIETPKTFNEKIQWLKLFDAEPQKSLLADKYLVRDWAANIIGEEHLIPLLGVWRSFEEIDFSLLPDKYVLKANHGCGWNIIVKNKKTFNREDARVKFSKWLSTNYATKFGLETHYANISPRIIAEKYIGKVDEELIDYRIFCFGGKPHSIWVDTGSGTAQHKRNVYDLSWNLQPIKVNYPNLDGQLEKPAELEQVIELATKLSSQFVFVRVDFYIVDGNVYFGEMTFTPQSGVCKWDPPETNRVYGELLRLPEKNESNFSMYSDKTEGLALSGQQDVFDVSSLKAVPLFNRDYQGYYYRQPKEIGDAYKDYVARTVSNYACFNQYTASEKPKTILEQYRISAKLASGNDLEVFEQYIKFLWSYYGPSSELLLLCDSLVNERVAAEKNARYIWLIFISSLIETKNYEAASDYLQKYIQLHGFSNLENYLPAAAYAYKNGYESKAISKSMELFYILDKSQSTIKSELEGKSIAIVGSGPQEINKGQGKIIDSHEVVIRFNNCLSNIVSQDYGKKINVWVRNLPIESNFEHLAPVKTILLEANMWRRYLPKEYLETIYAYVHVHKKKIAALSYRDELIQKIGTHPTTGAQVLYNLYRLGLLENADLYGFSFLEEHDVDSKIVPHYYKESLISMPHLTHDMRSEQVFLRELFGLS